MRNRPPANITKMAANLETFLNKKTSLWLETSFNLLVTVVVIMLEASSVMVGNILLQAVLYNVKQSGTELD